MRSGNTHIHTLATDDDNFEPTTKPNSTSEEKTLFSITILKMRHYPAYCTPSSPERLLGCNGVNSSLGGDVTKERRSHPLPQAEGRSGDRGLMLLLFELFCHADWAKSGFPSFPQVLR